MKIEGNQVILDKKAVSDWLCFELGMVHSYRSSEDVLCHRLNMIEGALGLLEFRPAVFREIFDGAWEPTDENLSQAYQAVIRAFGPSRFNPLAKSGGENLTDAKEPRTSQDKPALSEETIHGIRLMLLKEVSRWFGKLETELIEDGETQPGTLGNLRAVLLAQKEFCQFTLTGREDEPDEKVEMDP